MHERHLSTLLATTAAAIGLAASARADGVLIDPTQPATTVAQVHPKGEVHVEAILERDGRRVAIVAGALVHAGDRLSWGQVEAVTATGIRYVAAGKRRFAQLEGTKLHVRRTESQPPVSQPAVTSAVTPVGHSATRAPTAQEGTP